MQSKIVRLPVRLFPVAWLTRVLGFTRDKQVYDRIRSGEIPDKCIVRLGRTVRVNPQAVEEWLGITFDTSIVREAELLAAAGGDS